MIWKRDLLFLGLVGGGLLAVGAGLLPPRAARAPAASQAILDQGQDLREIIKQVNNSFRQQWSTAGVPVAEPATELLVARRLSLGLMGTVPSLEEVRQFEALPAGQRLPWWLDHIFEDRRWADYIAERLARAYVGTEQGPFILYRRRRFVAWLSESLAQNRPYDQIVHDLIADRGLWTDRPGTNFLTVTSQMDKHNDPDPIRMAGRVTRAFLGLRLDCAQCHNHPYAPWVKGDFDGLAAFFGQTHVGFKGIYDGSGDYETLDKRTQENVVVLPHVPFAADLLPADGPRRERLASWVTHPRNPYFARATVNRVWALLLGRPLVEPVDNLESEGPPPAALQILADDFAANGFDLRRLIRTIASLEVFRLESRSPVDGNESALKNWAVFPLTRLRPDQVAGSVVQASSISTLDAETHILLRLIRFGQQNEFLTRYGDDGEDEFDQSSGTIPQRLLLMNGKMVQERLKDNPINAATRIALLAPDDRCAVESAYLCALSRRPTAVEAVHFQGLLAAKDMKRSKVMEDLYWALVNSTEFSWNH